MIAHFTSQKYWQSPAFDRHGKSSEGLFFDTGLLTAVQQIKASHTVRFLILWTFAHQFIISCTQISGIDKDVVRAVIQRITN